MGKYAVGEYLLLETRWQSDGSFRTGKHKTNVGEVTEIIDDHKIRVRVFRSEKWGRGGVTKGYSHELLRINDDVWLETVRSVENSRCLPCAHTVVRKLKKAEFEEKKAELIGSATQS